MQCNALHCTDVGVPSFQYDEEERLTISGRPPVRASPQELCVLSQVGVLQ